MARPAGGVEHIGVARELLRSAKTAEELRRAQAVLLPLDLGLSLEQTARAIGRSVNATCAIRTRFAKIAEGVIEPPRAKTALRNHALADLEHEASILDEVLADAQKGGIVVIPQLKPLIEEKVGKPMALSTVYRMLARHGWRKLAPDTYHPQGDAECREVWKKTARSHSRSVGDVFGLSPFAVDVPGRSALGADQRYPLLLGQKADAPRSESHADLPIHVCLCGRITLGRTHGFSGPARGQRQMHAAFLR